MSLEILVFHAPQNRLNGPATRTGGRTVAPTLLALLAAFMLLAIGCAKPPEHPWVVRDGLIEVETYDRGQLFVRRDHRLGDYDNLLIDHVGFRYGRGQDRLKEGEEDRIVAMLLGAVQGSQDGRLGLAAIPGPCVLTVNLFLKDLEFEMPEWSGTSETNFVSSYGATTMVLELRDSMNQEPLARFIQRRDLGGGRATSTQSMGLRRLRDVMSIAIRDMGSQLRKVIPPTSGTSHVANRQCRGGLSEVALGSR